MSLPTNHANIKFSPRSYWGLITTQAQGAFSDNAYKTMISLYAIKVATSEAEGGKQLALIGALFIVPFIIFSVIAGCLADRYPKSTVTKATKVLEIVIMLLAVWGVLPEQLRAHVVNALPYGHAKRAV